MDVPHGRWSALAHPQRQNALLACTEHPVASQSSLDDVVPMSTVTRSASERAREVA